MSKLDRISRKHAKEDFVKKDEANPMKIAGALLLAAVLLIVAYKLVR